MEAWQYSALNARFTALQEKLVSTMSSCKTSNGTPKRYLDEPMCQDYYMIKGSAVKRKAEDFFELDQVKFKRGGSFRRHNAGALLMLDVYTQTEHRSPQEQDQKLDAVLELVQSNHHRLQHLERLIGRLVEENQPDPPPTVERTTRGRRKPPKRDIKHVLTVELAETAHPQALEYPSSPQSPQTATDSDHEPSPLVDTRSPPAASPTLPQDSRVPVADAVVHVGEWPGTQVLASTSRGGPDIGGLDPDASVTVPVIIAPPNKERESVVTEVPLGEVLAGATAKIEGVGHVSYARGCWLGDKLDPGSRTWYCGDVRVIHRAEASGVNPARLSLSLLEALFLREEMAVSNVNGARGHDVLNPVKIGAIRAHVNFKFPLEPSKQERRWHYIRPKIDSKCRAQRKMHREKLARMDNTPLASTRICEASLLDDRREKELLLYGSTKS